MFEELSVSISRLNHSLVATGCLTDRLQEVLLTHLGVNTAEGDTWPLSIYPRTLAVLAEIILLRQQKERTTKQVKSQTEAAIINLWTRFINTLTNNIVSAHSKTDPNDGECNL